MRSASSSAVIAGCGGSALTMDWVDAVEAEGGVEVDQLACL
jgi:hypothetical protein